MSSATYIEEKEIELKRIIKSIFIYLKVQYIAKIVEEIGYILSGDPTYITSHNGARKLIRQIERDELLENMVKEYLNIDEQDTWNRLWRCQNWFSNYR